MWKSQLTLDLTVPLHTTVHTCVIHTTTCSTCISQFFVYGWSPTVSYLSFQPGSFSTTIRYPWVEGLYGAFPFQAAIASLYRIAGNFCGNYILHFVLNRELCKFNLCSLLTQYTAMYYRLKNFAEEKFADFLKNRKLQN